MCNGMAAGSESDQPAKPAEYPRKVATRVADRDLPSRPRKMSTPAAGALPLLVLLLAPTNANHDKLDCSRAMNASLIAQINHPGSGLGWQAGITPRFAGASLRDIAALCGTEPEPPAMVITVADDPQSDARTIAALPAAFDWRTQPIASKCPSIGTVRDQAGCGSCWAFGTAESMSDRLCIASKGKVSVELSAQNIASCACPGGSCKSGSGCGGGQLGQAWDYYLQTGVVDGGLYGEKLPAHTPSTT